MNDVRLHVPYIFGKKQNSKTDNTEREDTEGTTESREAWYQERSAQGPNRPEKKREAKLTHGNLQISKSLCIIIRSCNLHE